MPIRPSPLESEFESSALALAELPRRPDSSRDVSVHSAVESTLGQSALNLAALETSYIRVARASAQSLS